MVSTGDKDRYSFPTDLSALHAEFTYFYYPGDFAFPREYIRDGVAFGGQGVTTRDRNIYTNLV